MTQVRIAVAGATGNVGREIVKILEEKDICKGLPVLLASSVSEGEEIPFKDNEAVVKTLKDYKFDNVDVVIFATNDEVSKIYVPIALEAGVKVIDLSDVSKADEKIEIIVPEVNGDKVTKETMHVKSPSSISTQLSMILNSLVKLGSVKQVVSTALMPVSHAGKEAVNELFVQSASLLGGAGAGDEEEYGSLNETLSAKMAFNCIPHVGEFSGGDKTSAELGLVLEVNRVLKEQIPVSATCIQVPTFSGCSQSLTIEFNDSVEADKAREVLQSQEGVEVIDKPEERAYSTPIGASETNYVYASRIRNDALNPNLLCLWVVTDNLRKGSALNAVQILELMF